MSDLEIRKLKSLVVATGHNIATIAPEMEWSEATAYRKMNGHADWSRSEMERFGRIAKKKPEQIFFAE